MRRYSVHTAIFIVLGALAAACSKDLGNYSYDDINELAIKGVADKYSVTTAVDTLRISPEVTATEAGSGKDRYKYYWIIRGSNKFLDTLGFEETLEYPVLLAPETYNMEFRTVDEVTGVSWWKKFELVVGTVYTRGILLIGENEQGNAEAEMLSMIADTVLVRNILSNSGLPVLKDPVSFLHTSGWEAYKKIWVFSKSGSYHLDRLSMEGSEDNTFGKQVYTSDPIDTKTLIPVALAPQVKTAAGATGTDYLRAMLCNDGSIFVSYLLLNGGDFYTNPMNRIAADPQKLLKAAPYLLYSINNMNAIVWYDTENQRFLNITNIGLSTASNVLTDKDGDPFPWNQAGTGRTLVYAENTRNTDGSSTHGNSFAVMKDAGNTCYLYKFYAYGSTPPKRAAYTVLPMAVNFDKADFYAFSSNRTVVFYSVGAKLYAYDYNPGNEKFYEYPAIGNDPITMLKFDTQMDYLSNSLYIATYNATTKGTLRRFAVGSNPNVVEITQVEHGRWDNLIKVKNMNWRAVN
ncbi:PKD-like family lipoprotein [Chitinophaga cymbidii]|uniref:PKD-like family protein n=1 Tax=Chitinophaga cymbidii TaxID=1096750 RepID=A0A512RT17_9BACT|nr:PKD-like family lipoprotein [Chitinophaga cymbidii]GEP98824.1 hypothetical protein CCY01nite_50840 [Chitinophaga cymbidii]